MSSIQDKVYEKENNGSNKSESNNWYHFFIYCLIFFVLSLFILVLGSNFIFISNADDSIISKLLPTDLNSYFKPEQQDGGGGGGGGASCAAKSKFKFSNWPYSMRKSASNTKGIIQSFKNWFANTTAETFIMNRGLIKWWVDLFSPINNAFLIYLIAILTISAAPLVYMFSLGAGLFNAFKSSLGWGLTSFFLMFIWPIVFGISFVQLIQYSVLFIFMPAFTDFAVLKDIINCNINIFFIFFGGLVSIASLFSLNNTITIIYTAAYLLMNIISLM